MTATAKGSTGTITWQSPSNIALIKYWGKKGFQLPANPSLSMTLSKAATITSVSFRPGETGNVSFDFLFEGKENPAFAGKLKVFFETIQHELQFLSKYYLSIESSNTIPHSAGIASSASSMSALALCLCAVERMIANENTVADEVFFRKVSHIARIGSGSAARSIYGGFVSWGETSLIPGSSDLTASPLAFPVHEVFHELRDSILIVSKGEKKVSSSAGHNLMNGHFYAQSRYKHAAHNLGLLLKVLESGNMEQFIAIVENEAMTLHALMMASDPGYILLESNTLKIIEKTRQFRQDTAIPIGFTLDAGPNVHLLYPGFVADKVKSFISNELKPFCQNSRVIDDQLGNGPEILK